VFCGLFFFFFVVVFFLSAFFFFFFVVVLVFHADLPSWNLQNVVFLMVIPFFFDLRHNLHLATGLSSIAFSLWIHRRRSWTPYPFSLLILYRIPCHHLTLNGVQSHSSPPSFLSTMLVSHQEKAPRTLFFRPPLFFPIPNYCSAKDARDVLVLARTALSATQDATVS